MHNKKRRWKWTDWKLYDDITGWAVYSSEVTKLNPDTSLGGLMTKWSSLYRTDWGALPYKLPTEENIPYTRIQHQDVEEHTPFDPETTDPMSTN